MREEEHRQEDEECSCPPGGAVALHCCWRKEDEGGSAGFWASAQPRARTQPRFWTVEDWMMGSELLLCCSSSSVEELDARLAGCSLLRRWSPPP